jgi:hypothetical protein
VDTNPWICNQYFSLQGADKNWVTHSAKVQPGNTFLNDYDILKAKINGVTVEFSTFHGVTYNIGDTFTSNTQVYYAKIDDIVHDINRANIPNVTAEAVASSTNPKKYQFPNTASIGIPGFINQYGDVVGAPNYFLRLKHSQGGDIVFDYVTPLNSATVQPNYDDQGKTVFTPDGQLTTGNNQNGYASGSTRYKQNFLASTGYSDSALGVRQRPLQVSTTDQLVTVKLTFQ